MSRLVSNCESQRLLFQVWTSNVATQVTWLSLFLYNHIYLTWKRVQYKVTMTSIEPTGILRDSQLLTIWDSKIINKFLNPYILCIRIWNLTYFGALESPFDETKTNIWMFINLIRTYILSTLKSEGYSTIHLKGMCVLFGKFSWKRHLYLMGVWFGEHQRNNHHKDTHLKEIELTSSNSINYSIVKTWRRLGRPTARNKEPTNMRFRQP